MIKNIKETKAITLIALIITIIVLLILAGVTISMLTGENGILKNAKLSSEKYSEESSREKLEVKLAEMQTEKILKKEEYNQNEYLTQELTNEGFGVSGDVVIVDGWQFLIDRSVPKIVGSLGKGIKNEGIQIELTQEVSGDYTKSTITIKVTPIEEINSILLNGEEVIELIQENGTITKEVTGNGTYSVIAKNTKDNYNMKSIAVTEITEDMDIWNKEDLVSFREKVNSGRTFEGRTVRVMADINLNEKKYTKGEGGTITFNPDAEQWTPIANYGEDNTLRFKGTFEGNNHTIKGLYIKNDKTHQGLFGLNSGTIKELTIEEGYINGSGVSNVLTGSSFIGAIVGGNGTGSQINNCTNKIKIEANTAYDNMLLVGGICGFNNGIIEDCINSGEISLVCKSGYYVYGGGIVGYNYGEVSNSINLGKLSNPNSSVSADNALGGVIGGCYSGIVNNCKNQGEITNTGKGVSEYASGISGWLHTGQIMNCVNAGKISCISGGGWASSAGITGISNSEKVANCYNRGEIICSRNGNSHAGGIISINRGANINLCYNTGNISNTGTGGKYTGGIAGQIESGTVTNCYFLSGTASSGVGAGTTTGTTAMTDANMKLETFVNTLNNLRQDGYLEWVKTETYPDFKQ